MDQIMSIRDYIVGEFTTVFMAPVTFVTAWAIVAYLTFQALRWSVKRQLENMRSTIDALTNRLDLIEAERNDYRDKLTSISVTVGASPSEDVAAAVDAMAMRLSVVENYIGDTPKEERGENANGRYERFRDGTQVCRGRIPSCSLGTSVQVTFPASFSGVPQVSVYPERVAVIQSVRDFGFSVRIEREIDGQVDYVSVGTWRSAVT